MSFTSLAFAAFLPAVFVLYWFVFRPAKWQNALLVLASLLFYGWADWQFVALLLLTGLSTWAAGVAMERRGSRWPLAAAVIALNLGVLAVFKYLGFFAENLAALLRLLGMRPDWATLRLILPVGVSFYTFQAVAYAVDVARGTVRAERDPVTFLAFLCFFPQLVAGPIERASRLLPQMQRRRVFDRGEAVDGLRQMLWGYVKKVVVADSCGAMVDQTWGTLAACSSAQLWMAALLFAFQIYCDFSGYSDIAIGCARLFGVGLSRNFAYPFFATDMRELWRRWHISLTSWFRDYVYIPLGGSRSRKPWRNHLNLLLVFALSGLWHGADWTFVLWGVYNALWVMATPRRLPPLRGGAAAAAMVATTVVFALGFVAFRAPDLHGLGAYVSRMFAGVAGGVYGWHALAYCCGMVAVEWVARDRRHGLQLACRGAMRARVCRWGLYYLLAMTVVFFYLTAQNQTAFIYFRF